MLVCRNSYISNGSNYLYKEKIIFLRENQNLKNNQISASPDNNNTKIATSYDNSSYIIDTFEISNWLIESSRSIPLGIIPSIFNNTQICFDRLLQSSSKIIFCNSQNGFFNCYDIDNMCNSGNLLIKLKQGQVIADVCASRDEDGIFFFSCSGEATVRAFLPLYTTKDGNDSSAEQNYDNNKKISISSTQPFSVDSNNIFSEKFRNISISSLCCHPTKSILFVICSHGSVQIWQFSNLRKGLHDCGGDDDDEMDESDDTGSIASSGSKFKKNQVFGKKPIHQQSAIPKALLIPPPAVVEMCKQNRSAIIATSFTIDPNGKLASVVWNNCITSIYDIRMDFLGSNPDSILISPIGVTNQYTSDCKCLSISFHPTAPIIFQAVLQDFPISSSSSSSSSSNKSPQIVILSLALFEPSLRIVGRFVVDCKNDLISQNIEHLTLLGIQCTSIYGQIVVNFRRHTSNINNNQNKNNILTKTYTLSHDWLINHGCGILPITTKIPVPPDVYLEGDSLLRKKEESSTDPNNINKDKVSSDMWPMIIGIYTLNDIFDKDLRPLRFNYPIFSLRLNSLCENSSHVNNVGSVPANAGSIQDSWFKLSKEDQLNVDGPFFPTNIILNKNFQEKSWSAIIRGILWSPYSEEIGRKNELQATSTICFIKFLDDKLKCSFSSYLDARYWYCPSNSIFPKSILAICSSSKCVKSISVGQNNTEIGQILNKWDLPFPVTSLWTACEGGPDIILYLSINELNDSQSLFASKIGEIIVNKSSLHFQFQSLEKVIDVQWQPLPNLSNNNMTVDQKIFLLQLWKSSRQKSEDSNTSEFDSLLGVLTNKRVIIFNSHLQILNFFQHSDTQERNNKVNVKSVSFTVTSISWVGASLLSASESGAISFLLPGSFINLHQSKFPSASLARMRSLGLRNNKRDLSSGSLCSFPRNFNNSSFLNIVCCLPDRLIVSTISLISGSPKLIFSSRPCHPVEPLLLGLLANRIKVNSVGSFDEDFKKILVNLITFYIPVKDSNNNSDSGALPNTQATRKLCFALLENGFSDLAFIASGLTSESIQSNVNYPRNRWIPSGIKFDISCNIELYDRATLDLLSAKSELQEIFKDPESSSSSILPHRNSLIAQQLTSAAIFLKNKGKLESSRKSAELAGNDATVISILSLDKLEDGRKNIKSLCNLLEKRNPSLFLFLFEYLESNSQNCIEIPYNFLIPVEKLSTRTIGHLNRRPTFQVIKYKIESVQKSEDDCSYIDLIEKTQLVSFSNRGGGLGAPTLLGVLAMDWIEDWVGARVKPQILTGINSGATNSRVNVNKVQSIGEINNIDKFSSLSLPNGISKPLTWIDDVGQGEKEWDNIVGYWRFSDIIHPGEEDFISSSFPGARISFLDLSKYSSALELFCQSSNSILIEETTSSVDTGDDHSKVKSLYDVIFVENVINNHSVNNNPCNGMRVVVGRGGPLDIGLYHSDIYRSKVTIELNVYFDDMGDQNIRPSNSELLSRQTTDSDGNNSKIWSISADNFGALHFSFSPNHENRNEDNTISSPQNMICMGLTDSDVVSWTHIAIIIDSSDILIDSKSSSIYSSFANVTIYINGEIINQEKLSIPEFSESRLASTNIFVGPDLAANWRLTELRFWAAARTSSEIDGQKENYLALASKRKRLQFRVGGKKNLFGSFKSESLILGEPVQEIMTKGILNDLSDDATKSNSNKDKVLNLTKLIPKLSINSSEGLKVLSPVKFQNINDSKKIIAPLQPFKKSLSTLSPHKENVELTKPPPIPTTLPPDIVMDTQQNLETIKKSDTIPKINIITNKQSILLIKNVLNFSPVSDVRSFLTSKPLHMSCLCFATSTDIIILPHISNSNIVELKIDIPGVDGIILSNRPKSDLRTIIAIFSNDIITIFDATTASSLVKIADYSYVLPPLIFWTYTGLDTLLLVTSVSAYSLKLDGLSNSKPIKILDRIDLKDPERWEDRRVVDVQIQSAEGWIMITTCLKAATSNDTKDNLQRSKIMQSSIVSIYQVKSGKFCSSFEAIGGCFSGSNAILSWISPSSNNENFVYSLSSIDLKTIRNLSSQSFHCYSFSDLSSTEKNMSLSDVQHLSSRWITTLSLEMDFSHINSGRSEDCIFTFLCVGGEFIIHFATLTGILTICNITTGSILGSESLHSSANGSLFSAENDIISMCLDNSTNSPAIVFAVDSGINNVGNIIRVEIQNFLRSISKKK